MVPRASLPQASWPWNLGVGSMDERIRPKIMLSDSSGLKDVDKGECSSMMQKLQIGDGQSGFCLITPALCDLQIPTATIDTDETICFTFTVVKSFALSYSPGSF
jgi:hypothetical protein